MFFDKLYRSSRGFTLLELMIVMAILAILSGGVVIWFMGYQRQAELDSTSKMIVDTLRDAQSRSISGKDFKSWGVCFDASGNRFILFRDDGVDCAISTIKEENYLSSFVKIGMLCPITGVCLNGGGNKIIFNNLNGGTAQYGTIRIEQSNDSASFKNVVVTELGKIDRQ